MSSKWNIHCDCGNVRMAVALIQVNGMDFHKQSSISCRRWRSVMKTPIMHERAVRREAGWVEYQQLFVRCRVSDFREKFYIATGLGCKTSLKKIPCIPCCFRVRLSCNKWQCISVLWSRQSGLVVHGQIYIRLSQKSTALIITKNEEKERVTPSGQSYSTPYLIMESLDCNENGYALMEYTCLTFILPTNQQKIW